MMNKAMWIVRKNYLCGLIKKVSEGHGGDDIDSLRQHCREVLEAFPGDLIEIAIKCYEDLVERLRFYKERKVA